MYYGSHLLKLGGGQDSTVWRRSDAVVKFYQKPSFDEVIQYHRLQNYFRLLVLQELEGRIRIPGNISWKGGRVSSVGLSLLQLPENKVFQTYGELVGIGSTPKICPEGYGYKCISSLPYVGGDTLPYHDEGSDRLRETITDELVSIGVPLSDKNPISPANVKVTSFYRGELSLVITDVGASIMNLLETASKEGISIS